MKNFILALLLISSFSGGLQAEESLAAATIVVFNANVPESLQLAKFYAEKRGIARDHLVGLNCSKEEEISREEYDRTIAGPLRAVFKKKEWWTLRESAGHEPVLTSTTIRFVALIKGMPMKVRAAEKYGEEKPGAGPVASRNEASVDSEVALLGRFGLSIYGAVNNPYFQSYRRIMETGSLPLLLVCRLDAPTGETVRRMITDAIETETNGLWGRAYVDAARNSASGYEAGDEWLMEVVKQMGKAGIPTVYEDTPAVFPDGYPMTDCALYYGWYTGAAAGPFAEPTFRLRPGAIAVHIHSFSASTLRDPKTGWVGPLLTKGAAASVGNVYEPYLELSSHLDILNDRLLHGLTFAESAYMSLPGLSWMSVAVGDPLYRPYVSWLQLGPKSTSSEWKMYHDFAVENASLPASEYRVLARQAASRADNGVMIEDLGLMEARDGNHASAAGYFQQARTLYKQREDVLRVVLEEADSWVKQEKPQRALELVRTTLRIISEGSTAGLLRKVEQDLDPKPPSPAPRP